jgi:hypothetical protein
MSIQRHRLSGIAAKRQNRAPRTFLDLVAVNDPASRGASRNIQNPAVHPQRLDKFREVREVVGTHEGHGDLRWPTEVIPDAESGIPDGPGLERPGDLKADGAW